MVTGWGPAGGRSSCRSPDRRGDRRCAPAAVVLATGCRERPRSARLVPGARPRRGDDHRDAPAARLPAGPAGGAAGAGGGRRARELLGDPDARARRRAHGRAQPPSCRVTSRWPRSALGARAALPGAAVDRHARERDPRPRARGGGGADRARQRADAHGSPATRWCSAPTGSPTTSWRSLAGLELDPSTRGPAVDAALRGSRAGVFAAGNVLHGAEQADVAALSGRHAAAGVARFLADGDWPAERACRWSARRRWAGSRRTRSAPGPARRPRPLRPARARALARARACASTRTAARSGVAGSRA